MTNSAQRTFRFSLRTMFLAVMLFSVFLGWLGTQLKWMHDRREALRWMSDSRARQLAAQNGTLVPATKGYYISHSEVRAPWSIRIFGAHGVEQLKVNQAYLGPGTRYSLVELKSLFPEADVRTFNVFDPGRVRKEWLWLIRENRRAAGVKAALP